MYQHFTTSHSSYSTVRLHAHATFCLSIHVHFSRFHLLTIMNSVTVNFVCKCLLQYLFSVLLNVGGELLSQTVILYLGF